ncbi:unnamed protein product [Mycena citricolor]|uniref:Uncharacterized protein n=1 Tax=Mycena citricolor TaxID=2018698 RepID=A0AAD2H3L6_9AGAR|nr:unnamed protein product [Mycena citricolor]
MTGLVSQRAFEITDKAKLQSVGRVDNARVFTRVVFRCFSANSNCAWAMADPPSTGLLSGVFTFVARELESFIVNATGGTIEEVLLSFLKFSNSLIIRLQDETYSPENSPEPPEPSSSTRLHDSLMGAHDSKHLRQHPTSPAQRRSRPSPPRRRQHDSPAEQMPSTRSSPPVDAYRRVVSDPDTDIPSSERNPFSPPPLPCILKRRKSLTMPGSLFPRSPSLEPGSHHEQEMRQVRFLPSIISPPARSRTEPIPSESIRFTLNADAVAEHESPPRLRYTAQEKGKARASGDADSIPIELRGMTRELSAACDELAAHRQSREEVEEDTELQRERELDKERIRHLEAEVHRLKQELSDRSHITSPPPPPAPPPPPPPGPAKRIPTSILPKVPTFSNLPTQETALGGSRRSGQPTIGVPPDKMADFLAEMKTVRLKKTLSATNSRDEDTSYVESSFVVGGRMSSRNAAILKKLGDSISRSQPSTTGVGDRSWNGTRSTPWLEDRSFDSAVVGGKRKRAEVDPSEDQDQAPKRRFSASSSFPAAGFPKAAAYRDSSTITPSLSSDRGNDDSDERSLSTPPAPAFAILDPPAATWMPIRKIFVPPPRRAPPADGRISATPPRQRVPSASEQLDKRPPSSPIAVQSPRKPRPPGRLHKAARVVHNEESDDELSLSYDAPVHSPPHKTAQNMTLDQELVAARSRVYTRVRPGSQSDPDSGLFVGLGSRAKNRGFLARGGAGGSPVFMGVGYVQGVDNDDESRSPGTNPRKGKRI